jgi:flagellar FliL protein
MKKLLIILILSSLCFISCKEEENPINSYYRNIPMVQGMTRDEKPKVYNVKIDLGYEIGNKKIQTELNKRKDQLTDLIRSFFSTLYEEQFYIDNQPELKELVKDEINEILIEGEILEVYFMELQVFEYN